MPEKLDSLREMARPHLQESQQTASSRVTTKRIFKSPNKSIRYGATKKCKKK
jgi:hypothetical protein